MTLRGFIAEASKRSWLIDINKRRSQPGDGAGCSRTLDGRPVMFNDVGSASEFRVLSDSDWCSMPAPGAGMYR